MYRCSIMLPTTNNMYNIICTKIHADKYGQIYYHTDWHQKGFFFFDKKGFSVLRFSNKYKMFKRIFFNSTLFHHQIQTK